MKHAPESRAVKKLRKKVKERLKFEEKFMSKRMLKKVTQIIQLKIARNELDHALEKPVSELAQKPANDTSYSLAQLKMRIKKDEKKLVESARHDLKIKPITSLSISSLSSKKKKAKKITISTKKQEKN